MVCGLMMQNKPTTEKVRATTKTKTKNISNGKGKLEIIVMMIMSMRKTMTETLNQPTQNRIKASVYDVGQLCVKAHELKRYIKAHGHSPRALLLRNEFR